MEYDPDIQQSAVVKIFPQDKTRSFHKFQWIYMPLIYAIFIPRWVFYRDFKDISFTRIGGFYNRPYPIFEIIKMLAFKFLYILHGYHPILAYRAKYCGFSSCIFIINGLF